MKAFADRHGLPTAVYQVFGDQAAARAYVRANALPLVIKADGLAAGKGVISSLATLPRPTRRSTPVWGAKLAPPARRW